MNKHRSARLWVGFVAVAAIALLAAALWPSSQRERTASKTNHDDVADSPLGDKGAPSTVGRAAAAPPKNDVVGEAAPEEQTTPEQAEARELLAKRYKEAQHSPHRLEWAPEEVRPSNMVFDLCDDVQAKEAGLALNSLDEDRYSLGIDCSTSEHRFAYIPPNEAMRFANSYKEAETLLKEFAEEGSIKGEKFTKPIGMLMGHRGPWPVDIGLALDPCGTGFGCASASIDVGRGTTRGIFANVSNEVAHNVTISAGNVVARHPLSVQPGESTAFELPAELSTAQLATLSITGRFVASPDPRRAVLLMGAPGDITGPRDELAKRHFGIPSNGPPVITYFEEALMLENSTTHPEAAQSLPGQVLDAPTAVVASLDERLKVIQVLRLPVTLDENGSVPVPVTAMAFVKIYTIGFIVPPEAAQFFISIGGVE